MFTVPFALSAVPKSTYPNCRLQGQKPRFDIVLVMAPVAPPSGKLLKLLKEMPLSVPVGAPLAKAARIITSEPPFPWPVVMLNIVLLRRIPTDYPLVLAHV